jgi:hypothetical protein
MVLHESWLTERYEVADLDWLAEHKPDLYERLHDDDMTASQFVLHALRWRDCPSQGKVGYTSLEAAEEAAERFGHRAYRHGDCGSWHTTSHR